PDEDATFAPDSLDPEFAGFRAQRQLPAGRGNGNAGSWTSRPGLLATPGGEVVALEASGCTIDQYIVCAVEMHCFPRHALDDDVGESQARTGGFDADGREGLLGYRIATSTRVVARHHPPQERFTANGAPFDPHVV